MTVPNPDIDSEDLAFWAAKTDLHVQQEYVYTSENMFLDIVFAAEEELIRRGLNPNDYSPANTPEPQWYIDWVNRRRGSRLR